MGLHVLHVEAGQNLYGGALQVFYLLEGLAQRGVRNTLVAPSGSAIAERARGIADTIHTIAMGGDLDLGLIGRLRRIIREEKPDIVHLHSRRGADVLGGLAARLERVPAVLSRRVDNPESRWWVGLKYRLYARTITISNGIREVLIAQGLDPARITLVHSAVDTERFRPGCVADRLRRTFELAEGAKTVGVIAQLIARKGHGYLLQAASSILQHVPETRFIFFGKGPLETELRMQCARLGLAERVIFAGFRDDLAELLPCLDVVVHPAEMEGLGVSLLQAAACAVPVVATPAGGIPEIVRDGETGCLVPIGDPQRLARAVTDVLSTPVWGRELGARGRALVEREFSVNAMVSGNIRVYNDVVGKGGTGSV